MNNLLQTHADDKKKKLVDTVYKRFQLSQSNLKDKKAIWEKCYKQYRAHSDGEGQLGEPDIKIAFIFGVVEKIVSKLISPFAGKLPINIKPKQADQEKQAENYYTVAKDFHNSPKRLIDYTNATRERVITGSCWESEEWQNIYTTGTRWVQNKVTEAIDVNLPTIAKPLNSAINGASKLLRDTEVAKWVEDKYDFPVKVGYSLTYPSIFTVFPQPGVLKVEDLKWIIEEEPFVAIEDLRAAKYKDENGEFHDVYDLSFFDNLKKDIGEDSIIIPASMDSESDMEDFKQQYADISDEDYSEGGVDGVYLLTMKMDNEIYVVANNQIIQHIEAPYHKPGIKMRLRVYTPDPHSLYGLGAVEPVSPMLEELDDVHNLSMANWVRIINKMVAYDESAVLYPDDFNPRAGGKIRIKPGTDLSRAMMPIEQANVTGDMITTESNLRGLIETILSVTDFAPGSMGTKPYHETKGGLMEIKKSYAQRFATILLIDQAETMKQMESMYWFYEQFMFDEVTIDGNLGAVNYSREDIDTDGNGFLYVASSDPSLGDTAVQRNQAMILLRETINYEKERITMGKLHWKEGNASRVFEDVLLAFKQGDTDEYLVNSDETESPENEFKFMIQGIPVEVSPKENLTKHYLEHQKQMKRIETGQEQYDPEVVAALQGHIVETQDVTAFVLQNPEQFVDDGIKNEVRAGSNDIIETTNVEGQI